MLSKKMLVLATVTASTFFASMATAAETATLVNRSNKNIALYAKWSHVNFESRKIVLAPGERRQFRGPDGANLWVRFNSTPGVSPARERRYRVISTTGVAPQHPGFPSFFRNVAPHVVNLFDK